MLIGDGLNTADDAELSCAPTPRLDDRCARRSAAAAAAGTGSDVTGDVMRR